MRHPDRWGHLRERYSNPDRPHRLLAIDGGGIRGVLALGILEQLQKRIEERHGPTRLCDYFDYIAGNSTGAIIAAGLAIGMTIGDLITFYDQHGEAMFEPTRLFKRARTLYSADPLRAKLQEVFQKRDLRPEHLGCLLLIVTSNATTDSGWPISSNPEAKYNDPDRKDCNLQIPLWQLVRASTAAPVFFPPEQLNWDPTDPAKTFTFVDGGVTPHNNPSFLLYKMATQSPYRLGWAAGEDRMLIVSVGTGAAASTKTVGGTNVFNDNLFTNGKQVPGTLMYAIAQDQDMNCRVVGRCTYGAPLDREICDLIERDVDDDAAWDDRLKAPIIPLSTKLGRQFLYARYNADLSQKGLEALGCADIEPASVRSMDCVEAIKDLLRIGRAAGRDVSLDHFGPLA